MNWVIATLIIISILLMAETGRKIKKATKEAVEAREKAERELEEIKRMADKLVIDLKL